MMNTADLEKKIYDYCTENKLLGVLRITEKDKIILDQKIGYADVENKIPFDDNSMFSFYSLSKPFCVLGFMKLYDKGLVDINAHPMEYIPEARGFDSRVTLKQCLLHRSGLPDFDLNNDFSQKYAPGYPSKVREHLKLLVGYPQFFEPDVKGKYENVNILLCALAIENISGMSYAEYMKKEVFEPLGMERAVVDNESLYIPNRVKGYELENGELVEVEKNHNWMLGAGDIVGTVDDVYKLNLAIKHGKLVNEETWKIILTPSSFNDMAMGCTVTKWHGKRRIHHNGGSTGFRTFHIQLPEDDFDIIIMSNSGFGRMREDLSELIYSAFYGEDGTKRVSFEMDKGYAK